ncbi:MAG: hypothetical protein AAGM84_02365 [Pseudomonadota bacterium]
MAYVKEIGTAAATLICAVGIGFIMQSSDTAKERYGTDKAAIPAQPAPQPSPQDGPVLAMDAITLTSAQDTPSAVAPLPQPEPTRASAPDVLETPPAGDLVPQASCEATMTATPDGAGYVRLSLDAPCRSSERFVLHHSGMMTTQVTSLTGAWGYRVPALSENAVFIAAFADGEGAVAQTVVPGMDQIDRIVLQWQGRSGFELHAREFGAEYGSDGHRYHGRRGEETAFEAGTTGRMERYGAEEQPEALMAEVYTFPRGKSDRDGTIDLTVEAEVTVYNCGLEIGAQSLELKNGTIRTQDLTLAVSACDTIGSFLVLNNLVQDLKVAAR